MLAWLKSLRVKDSRAALQARLFLSSGICSFPNPFGMVVLLCNALFIFELASQEPVSEAELEALRGVFALFDTDGTGEIDSSEFATILSKVGRDPAEGVVLCQHGWLACICVFKNVLWLSVAPLLCAAAVMLRDVDPDMSGKISFEEFVKLLSKSRGV